MVALWRAPHSYTGEDACEISCHGSAYIMEQILHRLTEAGCRQAQPGEYTQRAYLNGRLDLSQAEAVADLIASTNRATYRIALSQLKGHFSSELSTLREQLLKMTSLLELELDFSDHEELEFADRTELAGLARQIDERVLSLAHSFETGKALKRGIPVAIVGKTNVASPPSSTASSATSALSYPTSTAPHATSSKTPPTYAESPSASSILPASGTLPTR